MPEDCVILGIDPSTAVKTSAVGAVVGFYDGRGLHRASILASAALVAPRGLRDRAARIGWVCDQLETFLREVNDRFPLSAAGIEIPFVRGDAATRGINEAIGAIKGIPVLRGIEWIEVRPQTAKALAGANGLDREPSKQAVIHWANMVFRPEPKLGPSDDAIADALAVMEAAYRKRCVRVYQGQQGTLPGTRSAARRRA